MASVSQREIVDIIIENDGVYPGDESTPVVKIVEYNNQFDGGLTWGLIYEHEDLNRYHTSPACINPKTIWERSK